MAGVLFRPRVAIAALLLWNVPGLCVLVTMGERPAILVIAATSLLGAALARAVIWTPALQGIVLSQGVPLSMARKPLKQISNGLLVTTIACLAAYGFLSIR